MQPLLNNLMTWMSAYRELHLARLRGRPEAWQESTYRKWCSDLKQSIDLYAKEYGQRPAMIEGLREDLARTDPQMQLYLERDVLQLASRMEQP